MNSHRQRTTGISILHLSVSRLKNASAPKPCSVSYSTVKTRDQTFQSEAGQPRQDRELTVSRVSGTILADRDVIVSMASGTVYR